MTNIETRSPIREVPKRQAGESTMDNARERILLPTMQWISVAYMAFGMLLGVSMVVIGGNQIVIVTISSVVFLICATMTIHRFRQGRVSFQNYVLGAQGERTVADLLEQLVRYDYHILHDISGQQEGHANTDHLVVGPGGMFVIETKTRSKPGERNVSVTYDGRTLLINGIADLRPLEQVRMLARETRERLARLTGRNATQIPVRPVVVFPGWYVESNPQKKHDVWVFNPKGLVGWIRNEPQRLSPEDVKLYSSLLERF